ncbi:MAG: ABC transporter ATP-binding protein [Nitrososphaeria archaeon]
MAKIILENITHIYAKGQPPALEDVNMVIEDKSRNALLGPSGCGKTTLLKIICGLLKPTKGRIYFDDEDVTDLPPEKRNIAIIFQFPVVYNMSVYDNLMFPLRNLKIPVEEKKKKVLEVAESLGLSNLLRAQANRLGPADRQRVALGRVLVRSPKAFLFDEPLSSIEPEKKVILKTEIKRIQEKLNQTTIYVTHDQTEALTFADKIAVMDKGRVLQYDTVENIYARPKNVFVGFFIGFPGMNTLDGQIKDDMIDLQDFSIKLPKNWVPPKDMTNVKVGIRPEHIQVSIEPKQDWYCFRVFACSQTVKGFNILHLTTDHQTIKVRSNLFVEEGSKVWVNFPPEYIHLFDEKGERISM